LTIGVPQRSRWARPWAGDGDATLLRRHPDLAGHTHLFSFPDAHAHRFGTVGFPQALPVLTEGAAVLSALPSDRLKRCSRQAFGSPCFFFRKA